jgi:prepilin-type N-terminal cleavage/methylation domain-containing protein
LLDVPLHPRPPSARPRGFTLVELLTAMSAGVLVAMAALILARNATRFFQHEARISAAQLAVTLGMNRLTADIQRASFLASPSHNPPTGTDPCQGAAPLPPAIRSWTSIAIQARGSEVDHPAALAQGATPENDLHPDSIIIGGSLATTERFSIDEIDRAFTTVTLRITGDEAMGRLREAAENSGEPLDAVLQSIFKPGRFLRVVDDSNGIPMYGIIDNLSPVDPADPSATVRLKAAFPLPGRNQVAGRTCGVLGVGGGQYTASVVYRVKYDIRSLQGDRTYEKIVGFDKAIARVSGEDTRTELVRVELDENGDERPTSLELIAELAVDLKFGITMSTPGPNPTLTTFPFDAPQVQTTPAEQIRAVQVRLATRTRVPDREIALSAGGQPYRFAVKPAPLTPRFARIRSLHTTVALPNQADFKP